MPLRTAKSDTRSGPLHYWAVMRQLSKTEGFTIREIWHQSAGVTRRTVKDYVRKLAEAGHLTVVGHRRGRTGHPVTLYRVADPRRVEAPYLRRATYTGERGRAARRLWNAIRVLKAFSVRDLVAAASTQDVAIKEATARDFVRRLAKAGYLAPVKVRGPGTSRGFIQTWRLLAARNTGPQPPEFRKDGTVFDVNDQALVGRPS